MLPVLVSTRWMIIYRSIYLVLSLVTVHYSQLVFKKTLTLLILKIFLGNLGSIHLNCISWFPISKTTGGLIIIIPFGKDLTYSDN